MIPCEEGGTGEAIINIQGGSGNYQYSVGSILQPVSENPFTIELDKVNRSVRIIDDNDGVIDFTIEAQIEGGETIEIEEGSERIKIGRASCRERQKHGKES